MQLSGHFDTCVVIDRAPIFGPETNTDGTVERLAQLSERAAAIFHFSDIHPIVRHRISSHVVGCGKGHPAVVGREAQSAFTHLIVVRQALNVASADFHEELVCVKAGTGNVTLIPFR